MIDLRKHLDPSDVWSLSRRNWTQIAVVLGWDPKALTKRAKRMGFAKPPGGGPFVEGPCVECGEVQPASDLSDDYRCRECCIPDSEAEERRKWLQKERQESRRRMRERKVGKRPGIEPVVFVDASGKPFPRRAW